MSKKLIAGTLVLTVALALSACSQDADIEAASGDGTEVEQAAQETSENSLSIEDVTTVESLTVLGDTLDMEIAYPQVVGMADGLTQQRVNKTIKQAFRSEHALLSGEANVVSHSYQVAHMSDRWISIRFDFTTDPTASGVQTYQLYTTFTVDMTSGEPILFHPLWENAAEADKTAFNALVSANLPEGEMNPLENPELYPEAYLAENELVVYYYLDGMQEVHMPLDEGMALLIKE